MCLYVCTCTCVAPVLECSLTCILYLYALSFTARVSELTMVLRDIEKGTYKRTMVATTESTEKGGLYKSTCTCLCMVCTFCAGCLCKGIFVHCSVWKIKAFVHSAVLNSFRVKLVALVPFAFGEIPTVFGDSYAACKNGSLCCTKT